MDDVRDSPGDREIVVLSGKCLAERPRRNPHRGVHWIVPGRSPGGVG